MPKVKSPDAVISSVAIAGLTVAVSTTGTKQAPGSTLTRWTMDYGDGSPLLAGAGKPPTAVPAYAYAQGGDYRLWLQVWDRNGLTDRDSRVIALTAPPIPPGPTELASSTEPCSVVDGGQVAMDGDGSGLMISDTLMAGLE